MMKRIIKRYVLPVLAIGPLQGFYRLLHRVALVGMNMGPVGEIETSGEAPLIRRLMRMAPSDAVVFDVGANTGEYSLRCARLLQATARVYAFEPSPSTFGRLGNSIAESRLQDRIVPVPEGLSDSIRSATLSLTQNYEGNASLHQRHQQHLNEHAQLETIHLNTLDAFCAERQIARIFLVKLDVEGEEFACLRGAARLLAEKRIDYVQFEFGGCNIQTRVFLKDFWDTLVPTFEIYRLLQNGLCPWEKYHELDEIFTTANFLAVKRGLPAPR